MRKRQVSEGFHIEVLYERFLGVETAEVAIKDVANLYCKIWKEPPWNEEFWTSEGVIEDIKNQLRKANAILLHAQIMPSRDKELHCAHRIEDPEQIGFTWGYEVSTADLCEISGIPESEWRKIIGAKRAFYIDELGVEKNHRKQGIGETLSRRLLMQVVDLGINYATLRTDVEAIAARNLYRKLGFRELTITDAQYPDRTYWLKKLNSRK